MFDSILGHEPVKESLAHALKENRLAHTLLFSGLDGIGKKKMAVALAAVLLGAPESRLNAGAHPDFHLIVPEGKSGLHTIDALKTAMNQAHAMPFVAPAQVFVIDKAERMQPAAANALLKTLEEPTPGSYWILVSASPRELLPTIVSRCAHVRFLPLATEHVAEVLRRAGKSEALAPLAGFSAGRALELADHPESEKARELLLALLKGPLAYPQMLSKLEEIERLVDSEDPLVKHLRIEHLFECIAMYLRDQAARGVGLGKERLFFPVAAPSMLNGEWEEALEEAHLGVERNLKLSACLEAFMLRIQKTGAP